jgi:hypothetical protein
LKLIVNDVVYDVTASLQNAALGDLLTLKLKTKTVDFLGVTVKFIQDTFAAVGQRMTDEPDFDPLELLGDEDFLRAMSGLIFLARRGVGETLDVSEAFDTKFQQFRIEPEDEDVDDAAPKESVGAANVEPI